MIRQKGHYIQIPVHLKGNVIIVVKLGINLLFISVSQGIKMEDHVLSVKLVKMVIMVTVEIIVVLIVITTLIKSLVTTVVKMVIIFVTVALIRVISNMVL
jgi:hypothetical protein